MFALSMKQGDCRIPLTDKSKELQAEVEKLKGQIELYEQKFNNQEENLMSTLKQIK